MAKQKTGLHKEISAIFSGVPLPNNSSGHENPSAAVTIENDSGHIPPRPAAASPKPAVQPEQLRVEETLRPKSKMELVSDAKLNSLFKKLNPYIDHLKTKILTPPPGVSPSKHMATVLMVPVLAVVAILIFGRSFFKSSPGGTNETNQPVQAENITVVPVKSEIEWTVPSPFPVGLRDPMQRVAVSGNTAVEEIVNAETFFIKGIVYSPDRPSAVIDTKIVYQGDIYKGAKIIKINIDSVEFEMDGKSWTQKIKR